jgi:deoxyribodipyrimidine photolyase-related protein
MSDADLLLVLGDQLDRESPLLRSADPARDRVLMIESREESQRVWSHKARTALFLSAMRHHAQWLRAAGWRLHYVRLSDAAGAGFETGLREAVQRFAPRRLRMVKAGEHGVQQQLASVCDGLGIALEVLGDDRFVCDEAAFADWRRGRKTLVMEHFYRHLRKRHGILMADGQPVGGQWNFDADNRHSFGRQGPGLVPRAVGFPADTLTREAIADVQRCLPDNPGRVDDFDWPVTPEQAEQALQDFIDHRLAGFGPYQDAMWRDEPWLYHSLLSAALNLGLLRPLAVVRAAEAALEAHGAPLQSVEGFVRQVLGWREYVHGIYWTEMPGYLDRNALDAELPLPGFYWTGDTDMACLRDTIRQTLRYGYAHHIQRLMVTGLFALLLGVRPREVHAWYLAVYVDAVEWVEAPNTLGMSQHADGGLLGSKPYAASGRYIQRMSNHCTHCRYRPERSTGEDACPFTTLYWDFLIRHEARFAKHPRAAMQWRMLGRLDAGQRRAVIEAADRLKVRLVD